MNSDKKYIVILCLGRSGSTLLTQLINGQIKDGGMSNETGGGGHNASGAKLLQILSDLIDYKLDINNWSNDMRTRIGKFKITNPHYTYPYETYDDDYFIRFLNDLLSNVLNIGDKNTTGFKVLFEHKLADESYKKIIENITTNIPSIKFICLTRNEKDIQNSRSKKNWNIDIEIIQLFQEKLLSLVQFPNVYTIKYEDLNTNSYEFGNLIQKMGLPYDHEKYIQDLNVKYSY